MRGIMFAAMMMAAGATAPAMAQTAIGHPGIVPEATGASALLAGRLDRAETIIGARLAARPEDPAALLNAAYLYERTGRTGDARAAYAAVLDRDDVALDLASGRTAMAHDLARARLGRQAMASR